MSDIKVKFDAAVEVIKNLPKNQTYQPSKELMLRFYSLYKQALNGPCNAPRPCFWDVVGKAKWEAWNSLSDMSINEAMTLYVEELKKVIETMPHSVDVGNFIHTLGNFYEIVDVDSDDNDDILKVDHRIHPKSSNSCESLSDKCSENSFYDVAPTFFGDFDACEAIKRLQNDLEILNQKVKQLESKSRNESHCICQMTVSIPGSQCRVPLFVLAGISVAFWPLFWIILFRVFPMLKRQRHLKTQKL